MQQSTLDQLRPLILNQLNDLIQVLNINNREVNIALQKYENRIQIINKDNYKLSRLHCLFDWAIGASKGDIYYSSFIKFVTGQISDLLNSIDPKFIGPIKNTGKLILLTFDDDPSLKNNPRFMNYLGELVGLNHIIQKGKDRFKLLAIEKKMPNSKRADFEFIDKANGDIVLIEFVSIHGIEPLKIETIQKFMKYLTDRFNKKIGEKTESLKNHYNRLEMEDGTLPNFTILPIIWSEIEDLLPFRGAFDDLNSKYANVLPCVSLWPQELEDGSIEFCMADVSSIMDGWEAHK